jgi:hypothetical protein
VGLEGGRQVDQAQHPVPAVDQVGKAVLEGVDGRRVGVGAAPGDHAVHGGVAGEQGEQGGVGAGQAAPVGDLDPGLEGRRVGPELEGGHGPAGRAVGAVEHEGGQGLVLAAAGQPAPEPFAPLEGPVAGGGDPPVDLGRVVEGDRPGPVGGGATGQVLGPGLVHGPAAGDLEPGPAVERVGARGQGDQRHPVVVQLGQQAGQQPPAVPGPTVLRRGGQLEDLGRGQRPAQPLLGLAVELEQAGDLVVGLDHPEVL